MIISVLYSFQSVAGDSFRPLCMSLLTYGMPLKSRRFEFNFLSVTHSKSLIMSSGWVGGEGGQGRIYKIKVTK